MSTSPQGDLQTHATAHYQKEALKKKLQLLESVKERVDEEGPTRPTRPREESVECECCVA